MGWLLVIAGFLLALMGVAALVRAVKFFGSGYAGPGLKEALRFILSLAGAFALFWMGRHT